MSNIQCFNAIIYYLCITCLDIGISSFIPVGAKHFNSITDLVWLMLGNDNSENYNDFYSFLSKLGVFISGLWSIVFKSIEPLVLHFGN